MDWSPEHVMSVEDRIAKLVNNDFQLALENAWWDRLMMERPSTGRKEFLEFLLTTADIHRLDTGQMVYDELVKSFFEFENMKWGTGLRVNQDQFEDNELGFVSDWAAQAGAAMALAPQYQAVALIQAGETALAYDGKAFYATDHPVNPFDTSKGAYSNLMAGLPLADGDGNPIEQNFALAEARMRSFKMPNGRNRNLGPTMLVVPPELKRPALTITGAKFISATENVQASSFQAKWNGKIHDGVEVIVINELSESPDDWYIATSNSGTNLLPLVYANRKPYQINSYNGITQAELNLRDELLWQIKGRNVAFYGHPFTMIKCKG
jgi:phage major head subunit gpT-like protein